MFSIKQLLFLLMTLLISVIFKIGVAYSDDEPQHSITEEKAPPTLASSDTLKSDPYPLDTCPVSGKKLGEMGAPVLYHNEAREIRFCCEKCVPKFEKEPARYLKKIDANIVEQQRPYYPLTTCVVDSENLGGEMGEPIELVYDNRLVRLCCQMCKKDFYKQPAMYLARLDEAIIPAQRAAYPLKTCVISGEELGAMGEPIEKVYGHRLVRFCCAKCIPKFEAKLADNLAKIYPVIPAEKDKHRFPKSLN